MLPASTTLRAFAILWLAACLWVLDFGYQQQHIDDMPVAFVWFMIYLTFPIGFAVSPLVGILSDAITTRYGLTYHPFFDLIPFWVVSVIIGYVQWFIVLPKLINKVRHVRSHT